MKTTLPLLALVASFSLAAAATAQQAPSGGSDAKGNAPIKHAHTVNDGSAKPGANSFTQNEARKHILHSGYNSVSSLVKGKDGVWRGTAVKDGISSNVALDFKGNVTDGGPLVGAASPMASKSTPGSAAVTDPAAASSPPAADAKPVHPLRHRHHRRRHHLRRHVVRTNCGAPGPNGVACSGADRNRDGIADKDEKAAH